MTAATWICPHCASVNVTEYLCLHCGTKTDKAAEVTITSFTCRRGPDMRPSGARFKCMKCGVKLPKTLYDAHKKEDSCTPQK